MPPRALIEQMRGSLNALQAAPGEDTRAIRAALERSFDTLSSATGWIVEAGGRDLRLAAAGASPYLRLFGTVAGGWLMGRAAVAAAGQLGQANGDGVFLAAKIKTARFYADNVLPQAQALATMVTEGGTSTLAIDEDQF